MKTHNWNGYKITLRTKQTLLELNISNKEQLIKLLRKDITKLWRIPQCGEIVKKELLKIAFN